MDTPSTAPPEKRKPGTRLTVATLLVLVATCAAIFWSVRTVQDADPSPNTRRWLHSKSRDRRIAAIRTLGIAKARDSEGVILNLIPLVDDPDIEVREEVLLALSVSVSNALGLWPRLDAGQRAALTTKIRAAVDALIATQKATEPRVRIAAVMALGRIAPLPVSRVGSDDAVLIEEALHGRKVLNALVEAMADPEVSVRLQAAASFRAVGVWAPAGPPAALFQALRADPNPEVRAAAAGALAGFRQGRKQAIPALFQAMEARDGRLARAAATALEAMQAPEELVPFLTEKLRSDKALVRLHAAILLMTLGPAAAEAVPELITMTREPVDDRLRMLDVPYPRELYPPLEHDAGRVAAYALGQIAPGTTMAPRAAAALGKMLGSELQSRRHPAAEALTRFGEEATRAIPAAVAALRQLLARDNQNASAAFLATMLGTLAPETPMSAEAIAVLTDALKPPTATQTRQRAALALSEFGPAAVSAAPQLRLLLRSSDWELRQAAEVALQAIGQPATAQEE